MRRYFLLFAILLLLYPSKAKACSCIQVTYEELIQRADMIFIGTLNSVEIIEIKHNDRINEYQKLTFQIENNYLMPGDTSEVVLFENNGMCSYDFIRSMHKSDSNKFMILAVAFDDDEGVFAEYNKENFVYITGYCTGSFLIDPPEWNYEHWTVDEQLHLIDSYFHAGLSEDSATPEKLYNEVWRNRVFHWFYTHEHPSHPGGYGADKDFIASNLQPCGLNEIKEDEWLGIISVSFTVTKEGEIIDIIPFSFSDSHCQQEAARVVEKMPTWEPAKVHGIAVSARTTVQVDFKVLLE